MTTTEIAKALEAWAVSVIPGLHSYEHAPDSLAESMPLVVAEVQQKRRRPPGAPSDFPTYQYQQLAVVSWEANLLFLVDPEDTWNASQVLYDMTDALGEALELDKTLGGRVMFASGSFDVSFTPPEVQYTDGTVARFCTVTITVGEQRKEM